MEDQRYEKVPEGESKDFDKEFHQSFDGSEFQEDTQKTEGAQSNPYAFQSVMNDPSKPKTKAFSILAMVFGILSVICCCLGWVSALLGVVAIVFVVIANRHLGYFDGMAIAGLVLGIIGTLLGVLILIGGLMFTEEYYTEDFYRQFFEDNGYDI